MGTPTSKKISRGNWRQVLLIGLAFVAGSQSKPVAEIAKRLMSDPVFRAYIEGTKVPTVDVPGAGSPGKE